MVAVLSCWLLDLRPKLLFMTFKWVLESTLVCLLCILEISMKSDWNLKYKLEKYDVMILCSMNVWWTMMCKLHKIWWFKYALWVLRWKDACIWMIEMHMCLLKTCYGFCLLWMSPCLSPRSCLKGFVGTLNINIWKEKFMA